MGNNANNLTRMAIKSMIIDDTEATENGENKNPIQQMQVQSYDAVKNCGKLGHYGFYGNSPKGSLVVVLQANGQEECLFGAEDDVNNRPRGLAEGEVMVYNTITKNYLYFDKDGNTKIYAKKDEIINITENSTIIIGKNSQIQIQGNSEISIAGNSNISVEGNSEISIGGNAEITAEKTTINGDVEVVGTLKASVLEAENGASGTYNIVEAEKGIVTSGS